MPPSSHSDLSHGPPGPTNRLVGSHRNHHLSSCNCDEGGQEFLTLWQLSSLCWSMVPGSLLVTLWFSREGCRDVPYPSGRPAESEHLQKGPWFVPLRPPHEQSQALGSQLCQPQQDAGEGVRTSNVHVLVSCPFTPTSPGCTTQNP